MNIKIKMDISITPDRKINTESKSSKVSAQQAIAEMIDAFEAAIKRLGKEHNG